MLNDHIINISKKVNKLSVQRQITEDSLNKKQEQVQGLLHSLQNHEIASAILLNVAKKTQQALAYRLSNLVTTCLASVFDEPYEFEVAYISKRGHTEVDFCLTRDGMSLDNPILSVGGGVVDVVAFALRIGCLSISVPPLRRVLILDEPFKGVRGYEQQLKVGELLKKLNSALGVQFIIIANDSKVMNNLDGKIIHVEKGICS
jgi:hypothetical protein